MISIRRLTTRAINTIVSRVNVTITREYIFLSPSTSLEMLKYLAISLFSSLSMFSAKYYLCTSNLTVPTHESNYAYSYVRLANSFSYKAIYALAKGHFEHRCIIQYR